MRIREWVIGCTLLFSTFATAQFSDQGLGAGVTFGTLFGQTELRDRKAEFFGRAFLRTGLVNHLQAEVGGGIGKIAGSEYLSVLVPLDVRLLVSPFSMEKINPYLYGGIGALYYRQQDFPASVQQFAQTGWTSVIPIGAGLQFLLNDRTCLEFTGGFNLSGSDSLNAVVTDAAKDAYWTFGIGLTVLGESGSADPDHDGLTNNEEKELRTDPKNPDTDGDGLSDGDEVTKYHTDPLKADSDGDGLKDGDEVMKYKTDPNKADTDGDGLSDGDEVLKYHTDPLKADTDGDGLSDGDEVLKYHTDPLKADTDGGTVNDGQEIANHTNPLDPTDDVKKPEIKVEVGKAVVLDGIVFESGKSDITAASDSVLELAYNTLKQDTSIAVEIRGYTDNTGGKAKNMKLSQARADAVKAWLVGKGIPADRVATKGFGPADPVAPNTTKEGKQKNRRIEFFRTK